MWGSGCVLLLPVLFIGLSHAQRLRDMMYEPIFSGAACYRRLNGTHQIGCSSKFGGSVGILHAVSGVEEVDWLLTDAKAGPYAPILPLYLFTNNIIDKLISRPDVISGLIVVHNGTNIPDSFSHEQRCPNEKFQWKNTCDKTADNEHVWNPHGTNLMYRDYPFPIFYLPPSKINDTKKLYECFYRFNAHDLESQSSRSLCAIDMNSFMFGAVNSEVCMRRSQTVKNLSPTRYCDPLADRSLYFTLFPRGAYYEQFDDPSTNSLTIDAQDDKASKTNEKNRNKIAGVSDSEGSIALVTAAMDDTSMFEGVGIGAVTTVSGLATLLIASHTLNQMNPSNKTGKNVVFVTLNGETYDYIGSQRMAWDLISGVFPFDGNDPAPPINPMSIGMHIHLGQFKKTTKNVNAFMPKYDEEDRNVKAKEFVQSLSDKNNEFILPKVIQDNNLPPSSLHSFLRLLNSSVTKMSSILLADHNKNFNNKYYQSILDNKYNINFSYLNLTADNVTKLNSDVYEDPRIARDSIQMRIANISTALARALYKHVTNNEYDGKIKASPLLVDELLQCYLDSITCPLLLASQYPTKSTQQVQLPPTSLYVGVSVWYSQATQLLSQLSLLLSGRETKKTKKDCKNLEMDIEAVNYHWIAGWDGNGTCFYSTVNYTNAMSPAFVETDYDFSSGQYSTWTESVWQSISLRILVRPPKWRRQMLLGIGCTVFIVSFILVFFARRHVIWLIGILSTGNSDSDDSPQSDSPADC